MKTFRTLLISVLTFIFGASVMSAQTEKLIHFDQLPLNSQALIKQYCGNKRPLVVKADWDEYEVIFESVEELEFDKSGEWKELDCRYSAVPDDLIPDQIKKQMKQLYPKTIIVTLERDKRGYKVRLSDGLEVEFDPNFTIVETDD